MFIAELALGLVLGMSEALMSGAPLSTCVNMTPGHGTNSGAATPYVVTPSAGTYVPGGTITVTVGGGSFQGILLEARHIGSTATVGHWSGFATGTRALDCAGQIASAATHSDANNKPAGTTFTWHAPLGTSGAIHFVATVAASRLNWWMDVRSIAINNA